MSLTGHFQDPGSPLRAWFTERFARTQTTATAANRELRAGRSACPHPAPPGSDRALVGTAIDLLLRARLAQNALDHTAATIGAAHLSAHSSGHAMRLEREAVALVRGPAVVA